MLLEVKGLTKNFGGLAAVKDFDMCVVEGEIMGLIGPNGAGKTTIFNLLTGVFRPTSGHVIFNGEDITGRKPHAVARLGIGRTFQLNPLFPNFTVLENVTQSFHLHPRSSLWDTYFNTATYRRNEKTIQEQALEILELVGLDRVKDELAKNQPHGYQKMLGVARALAVKPRLLLLDEPIAGMNPDEIEWTMAGIKKTQARGTTIVVVEHNMKMMELCDHVTVLSFGHKIGEGTFDEIRESKEVVEAYFGGTHVA
ncbi:MAG: ABC transporter ATP-binding protein [Armatimonadetes bacterium]|nr:ABC transporter ATP-binding protein [Armatimonadota bacterium]